MRWITMTSILALFVFGLLMTAASAEMVCGPSGCYEQSRDRSERPRERYNDRYEDRRRYDDRRPHRPRSNCAYVGGVRVCQ